MSPHVFFFESYGAIIRFEAEDAELLEIARQIAAKALVGNLRFIENPAKIAQNAEFEVFRDIGGRLYFRMDGEESLRFDEYVHFARTLNSMVRVLVAANARKWVFLHAGVVASKGYAIVLPAQSFEGKTTLVSELISAGADYYSDEYAPLDEEGLVHPFARNLSIRTPGEVVPVDRRADEFGAKIGGTPLRIGLVVLTRYEAGSTWTPTEMSVGNGILEAIPQVVNVRSNPKISLRVLNSAFRSAIILSGSRGDAKIAASQILSFFDNSVLSGRIS